MEARNVAVVVAVLLAVSSMAGCFGPDEDPVTTIEDTETTPGEDTVEAGATPQNGPVNDTAIAEGETTVDDGEGNDDGEDDDDAEE